MRYHFNEIYVTYNGDKCKINTQRKVFPIQVLSYKNIGENADRSIALINQTLSFFQSKPIYVSIAQPFCALSPSLL